MHVHPKVQCGSGVQGGIPGYPWNGETDAAFVWYVTDKTVSRDGSGNAASWQTIQAYTSGGAKTRYDAINTTVADRPAYEATGWNSKPSILGDGGTENLYSTNSDLIALVTGDDTPIMVIAAMDILGSSSGDTLWGFYSTVTANRFHRLINAGSLFRCDRNTAGTLKISSGLSSIGAGRHIYTTGYDGTGGGDDGTFRIDGAQDGAAWDWDLAAYSVVDILSLFATRSGTMTPSGQPNVRIKALIGIRNNNTTLRDKIEAFLKADAGI